MYEIVKQLILVNLKSKRVLKKSHPKNGFQDDMKLGMSTKMT